MKILTIDFDVIMGPSIDVYGSNPKPNWKHDPYLNILKIDYELYHSLTNYILEICENININNLNIITDHNEAINYCPKYESFELINIDHHHDIHYDRSDEDNKDLLEARKVNEGNWIYYLYTHPDYNLTKYSWLKNDNSETFMGKKEIKNFYSKPLSQIPIKQLPKDVDKLILCLSPGYTPPYVHTLFMLWLDLINQRHNIHLNFAHTPEVDTTQKI